RLIQTNSTNHTYTLSLHDALPISNQAKPNGQLRIEHGREKEFMAPLNISKIPMLGEKTCEKLYQYGIEKIADLQKASPIFFFARSEEHTSELQSRVDLVCRLLLEK